LTLLDGVYPSKKLFLLTTNTRYDINSHMLNRPGRLFYVIQFHGLNLEFVRGYSAENLNDKTQVEKVVVIAAIFDAFNLDMLKALIEECNRYNESPGHALKYLNVNPNFSSDYQKYDATWLDKDGNSTPLAKSVFSGNPITRRRVYQAKNDEEKVSITAVDFDHMDIATRAIHFKKGDDTIVVCPQKDVVFDWKMLDKDHNVDETMIEEDDV